MQMNGGERGYCVGYTTVEICSECGCCQTHITLLRIKVFYMGAAVSCYYLKENNLDTINIILFYYVL